jgi:hypothetical protein
MALPKHVINASLLTNTHAYAHVGTVTPLNPRGLHVHTLILAQLWRAAKDTLHRILVDRETGSGIATSFVFLSYFSRTRPTVASLLPTCAHLYSGDGWGADGAGAAGGDAS